MEDEFTPERVRAEVEAHDAYMDECRPTLQLHKAMYETRYWDHARSQTQKGSRGATPDFRYGRKPLIEINDFNVVVNAYVSALHKATQRVSCTQDLLGRGDPEKWAAVLNAWLGLKAQRDRVVRAFRQAESWHGCGLKIATISGTAPAHERVQFRVVPWWEVVLDRNVSDEADERFRGHVYWAPRRKVLELYPDLKGRNVTGQVRVDFLGAGGSDRNPGPTNARRKVPDADVGTMSPASDNDCVRILEFYNLSDTHMIDGVEYRGRLEVYLLGQDKTFTTPIDIDVLPFATAAGAALPNIVPVLFDSELEFPYRGTPPTARMIPPMVEQNMVRSAMSGGIRLNARKGVVDPRLLGSGQEDVLASGEDMVFAKAAPGWDRPLAEGIYNIPHHPMAADLWRYNEVLAADKAITKAIPPSTQGQYGKAGTTAYEVQTAALAHENQVGIHAGIFLARFEEALRLVICGVALNLTRVEDSQGGNDGVVALGPTSAREATASDVEDAGADAEAARVAASTNAVGPIRLAIGQDVLHIQLGDEVMTVGPADLDGECGIAFVEGIRTQMTESAKQQTLLALRPVLDELWVAIVKGGPPALLAEVEWRAIHDRFELPEDFDIDTLKSKLAAEAPHAETETKTATAPQVPPPEAPEAPGAQPEAPDEAPMLVRAQALAQSGDGTGALQVLLRVFGPNPAVRQVVQEAMASDSEEDRATAALQIVGMAVHAFNGAPDAAV